MTANSARPGISIVLCTFNGAAFIEAQLSSVLHQTLPPTELLIFDDASTDDTVAIVRRNIADCTFAKLHVNEKNIGFTANFEQGLRAARCEVIGFCDQDDVWVSTKLEELMAAWQAPNSLIYCDSKRFIGQPPTEAQPNRLIRRFEGHDPRPIFLLNTVSGHAILFRRELLDELLPLPANTYYDWFLAILASYQGGVQYLARTLVFQRIHGSNTSVSEVTDNIAHRRKLKLLYINALTAIVRMKVMPESHKRYALRLADLIKQSLEVKFHWPLFWFLLRHRHLIFWYKRNAFSLPSHVKHAIRRTLS